MKISIPADEVNISCDVTTFSIDKGWFDVIMPAYNKRFGGDNPNGVQLEEFFKIRLNAQKSTQCTL